MIRAPRIPGGIRAWPLLAALAGCSGDILVTANQENYITFEHPFTDQAAADIRKRAERTCEDRKLAALRLTNTCSLNKCFTTYRCMDKDDASAYGPAPAAAQR